MAPAKEESRDNSGGLGVRTSDRLVASYKNADFGDELLHAYTEDSRCSSGRKYLNLSNPFCNKKHPHEVRRAHFLIGESVGRSGSLYVNPVQSEPSFWDFSQKEERELDYTVYLWTFNKHPDLLFNQKKMKIDLLYFIPYLEIDDSIYVLSWNKEAEVSGSIQIKNYAVEFPIKGENNSHIGMIISPMLKIETEKDVLTMKNDIVDTRINLKLSFRISDSKGDAWILSWRKINIKRYINKKDLESINIEF